MNRVFVSGLRVYAYHGVLQEEQKVGRQFVLDIELNYGDTLPTGIGLEGKFDYGLISTLAAEVIEDAPQLTLEGIAGRIKARLLEKFPESRGGRIRVSKAHPPLGRVVEYAGVEASW